MLNRMSHSVQPPTRRARLHGGFIMAVHCHVLLFAAIRALSACQTTGNLGGLTKATTSY